MLLGEKSVQLSQLEYLRNLHTNSLITHSLTNTKRFSLSYQSVLSIYL